jgi:hypothetical protein
MELAQGEYVICDEPCSSQAIGGSGTYDVGFTDAWHTDGFTPNIIALGYNADTKTLTLYANGQAIHSIPASLSSGQTTITLGTASSAEAVYTHMTLYSPSGS